MLVKVPAFVASSISTQLVPPPGLTGSGSDIYRTSWTRAKCRCRSHFAFSLRFSPCFSESFHLHYRQHDSDHRPSIMFSCGTFSPPARKRASQSIPPPNLVSTSSTSDPDCAARRFIQVPELRQHLLSLLSPHDLAISMRVRQGYMYDVASILYHTVPYNQVRLRMSIQTVSSSLFG